MKNNTRNFSPDKKVFFSLPDTSSLSWRFNQRSEMQTRIYAQMLYRKHQGYKFYFGTLTYAPGFRPYYDLKRDVDRLLFGISKENHLAYSFADDSIDLHCPCFSRDDIRLFIRGIQRDLLKKYDVKDIDYIVASEYGSHSEFCPHYHFILMIPSKGVDDKGQSVNINAFRVHELVKKHWSVIIPHKYDNKGVPLRVSKGFVFPRTVLGGRDKKGHMHKPFEIDSKDNASIAKTAIYTSKYCCKQIGFWNNPDVKMSVDILKKEGTKEEVAEFRKHKPFIKTSLHFGECLKDVVFNDCAWSDGMLVPEYDDPIKNLYYGFMCGLKKNKPCSFPSYIKRKLLYDYELSNIKEEDITETFTYLLDDGTDFASVAIPITNKKKKTYQYGYRLSEFGKDFKKFEMRQCIFDWTKKMRKFYNEHMFTQDFKDYLRVNGYDYMYDYLIDFFADETRLNNLSLYRKVYKDKVNPLFLWWYQQHPEEFEDAEKVEYYDSKFTVEFITGLVTTTFTYPQIYFERYSAKDSVMSVDFRQYCDFDNEFAFGSRFNYPYFDYHSDISDFRSYADEFYCGGFDLFNDPTNEDFVQNYPISIFFNVFPCFANFDIILLLVESYISMLNENKLQFIETQEKEKSNSKNFIYAV